MVVYGGDKKPSHDRGSALSFPEIVGQEELKRALLTVAANPDLDGLLIRGEKGTAKSTAVRALADLLPGQDAVADCPYGCPPGDPERQCGDCRRRAALPTAERPVPLVTLPLGATRERVVGTLSVADALAGDYEFDPGLLARANRGLLYVDEVNLLEDHLVDVLLDAAASGVNRVERDGVSVAHPAEFTLVGTMNPEEGELRPQLRDRFALGTTVTAPEDVDRRVAVIERALGATGDGTTGGAGAAGGTDPDDPDGGRATVEELGERLRRARDRLADVALPGEFAREIAELCREAGVDGHRGDIAAARAARTFAALDGRTTVIEPDVRRAAALAVPHRLRSRPFEDAPDPGDLVDERFDGEEGEEGEDGGGDGDRTDGDRSGSEDEREDADGTGGTGGTGGTDGTGGDDRGTGEKRADGADGEAGRDGRGEGSAGGTDDAGPERADGTAPTGDGTPDPDGSDDPVPRTRRGADATGEGGDDDAPGPDADDDPTEGTPIVPGASRAGVGTAGAPELTPPEAVDAARARDGARARARPGVDGEGTRVRDRRADPDEPVDAAASVRAAGARGSSSVESRDLRRSVRRRDAAALAVFVVDASASMRPAMRAAKGTVLELLKDAYRQRDEVAFVSFAGEGADVLLPPTDSVTLAARHLKELPTGDRTPLPAGLRAAGDVLDRADPAAGVVVLVTDGRANVADGSPTAETREAARRLAGTGARVVVVDAGDGDGAGLIGPIVEETDGERVPLSALSADRIDAAVGSARESQL